MPRIWSHSSFARVSAPRHRWSSLALVLVLTLGHSAGMQVVAWASMLVSRVATESVSQAVLSTFDGSAPCDLCIIASALGDAERSPALPVGDDGNPRLPMKVVKPDLMPAVVLPVFELAEARETAVMLMILAQTSPPGCVLTPEPPPPRA